MANLDQLKKDFEARIAELMTEAKEIDEELTEPDTADVEDRATESEEDEVLESLGNAHLREIAKIEAAIKRIELGTYGDCTSCGERIDEKRLAAVPEAAMCIRCAA